MPTIGVSGEGDVHKRGEAPMNTAVEAALHEHLDFKLDNKGELTRTGQEPKRRVRMKITVTDATGASVSRVIGVENQ